MKRLTNLQLKDIIKQFNDLKEDGQIIQTSEDEFITVDDYAKNVKEDIESFQEKDFDWDLNLHNKNNE
jgi:hypothetical protein